MGLCTPATIIIMRNVRQRVRCKENWGKVNLSKLRTCSHPSTFHFDHRRTQMTKFLHLSWCLSEETVRGPGRNFCICLAKLIQNILNLIQESRLQINKLTGFYVMKRGPLITKCPYGDQHGILW